MPFKPGDNPNPTGKGGFADNPQFRADGRWKKENSFQYCLNFFKSLTLDELKEWSKDVTERKRTVAQDLAFRRIIGAKDKLEEFKEVANRTEGMPRQSIDATTNGESFNEDKYQKMSKSQLKKKLTSLLKVLDKGDIDERIRTKRVGKTSNKN